MTGSRKTESQKKARRHPNEGASLEDFLKEDGNLENATRVAAARAAEWRAKGLGLKKNSCANFKKYAPTLR